MLFLFVLLAGVHSATVWPKPLSQVNGNQELTLASSSAFRFRATGHMSQTLSDAFLRYEAIIFGAAATAPRPQLLDPSTMVVGANVTVLNANEDLTLETDYNYTLSIKAPTVTITAGTVYGAVYALETFSQLVTRGVLVGEAEITDAPRFKFRATMMDTSRHWYPLTVIKQHLDAMSYAKFNVFHWHIVDSQSFPFCSTTFPEMCEQGAWSERHVYTHNDVKEIVDYARGRGIRVLPEFDTPGHVEKGYAAIPDLLTPCYTDGKPNGVTGPLNPILNSTYAFLGKFYAEIKALFPDKFVHVGGDEVSFDCWSSNPAIQAWMKEHPEIDGYAALENYYEVQLLELLAKQDTSYMCWQEIFDNGVKILPDTVVNVWKGGIWQATMSKVTKQGFHSVLSAPFYLNYISYGLDWKNYYAVEPTNFTCDSCDFGLVGGVEACVWSEYIDSTNFIPRVWPRAAAVAERGWSTADTRDVADAQLRLNSFRCKLLERGVPAEPDTDAGFCDLEWSAPYSPPWN